MLLAPGDRKACGIFPGLDVGTDFTAAELRRWTTAGVLRRGAVDAAARDRIRRYGVRWDGPDQEIQHLSGGNQQKVVIGRVADRHCRRLSV